MLISHILLYAETDCGGAPSRGWPDDFSKWLDLAEALRCDSEATDRAKARPFAAWGTACTGMPRLAAIHLEGRASPTGPPIASKVCCYFLSAMLASSHQFVVCSTPDLIQVCVLPTISQQGDCAPESRKPVTLQVRCMRSLMVGLEGCTSTHASTDKARLKMS